MKKKMKCWLQVEQKTENTNMFDVYFKKKTIRLLKRVNKDLSLHWRHNGFYGISNHQPHHYLLKLLFRRRSKKTSKLLVTGLCVGNSPVTGEFPAQMASNMEIFPIWWRHHVLECTAIPAIVARMQLTLSRISMALILLPRFMSWHMSFSYMVFPSKYNASHQLCAFDYNFALVVIISMA